MTSLAVIVVSYNTREILKECLQEVYRHIKGVTLEVVVVDNNSHDGSTEMVSVDFPQTKLLSLTENLGFGVANNLAVEQVTAEFIMLLNSDAILESDSASEMVHYLSDHPEVVCVGPRINMPNGLEQPKVFGQLPSFWPIVMQSSGLSSLFPSKGWLAGIDGHPVGNKKLDVGWISGVCMVMRARDYRSVEGFDARYFMYCEDVDLCAKLTLTGRKITHLGHCSVMHYGGASSPEFEKRLRNAVWQQRHLLSIVRNYKGRVVAFMSSIVIFVGLILRWVGSHCLPKKDSDFLRASANARLRDLLGFTERFGERP